VTPEFVVVCVTVVAAYRDGSMARPSVARTMSPENDFRKDVTKHEDNRTCVLIMG